jgi:hypothetical protein
MVTSLRWLHLSDFHIGMDDNGQRKLFREICNHIAETVTGGFIPELVFITGNIANSGYTSEYSEFFDEFLDPMLGSLGDSWNGKVDASKN